MSREFDALAAAARAGRSVACHHPWAQAPVAYRRRCGLGSCQRLTSFQKPYCTTHVLMHPYALRVASQIGLRSTAIRTA